MITFDEGGPDDLLNIMVEAGWSGAIAALPRNEQIDLEPYSLRTTGAFRVAYPGLEDIERGYTAVADRRDAWRVILLDAERPLAQLEADKEHRPVAIHSGPAKDGIKRAFAVADALPGRSLVSAVECAALKFCALAVRTDGDDPKRPHIIPYAPDRTSLPLYELLELERVAERLRSLAAEIRKMAEGDAPTGG